MTTTDLARIGFQATPDGMLPCAVCGIPTTGPTKGYTVLGRTIFVAERERFEEMRDGTAIDLPTCGDCRGIEATAAAILAAHPGLRRVFGSPTDWQVTTALYGLNALGHTLPGPDIAPARLRDLVLRMSAPGALVAYSRRFSPIWETDATRKQSARTRWSAVDPQAVTACRVAFVDWLGDARPVRPLDKPGGGRCAWCGTSTSPGRRVSEAWAGDHCTSCAAIRDGGDDFQDAVWQAIDRNQAIRRRTPYRPQINGLIPWSQSRRGDGTPWSHLGGVDTVREAVKELLATL